MRHLFRKRYFYQVKDLNLISLRTAKSKQKSKEVFSLKFSRQTTALSNVKMVLFKNHSQYTWKPRHQRHQNKYEPQFQGYQGNTLSFKSSITKQNFLELPSVLQRKRRKDMTYKSVIFLDCKKLKIVWKKKTTFFKRRVSIIL